MKKIIFFLISLILFFSYFFVISVKTTILATVGYPVGDGKNCQYGYGVEIPTLYDWSKNPKEEITKVPQCNKEAPICSLGTVSESNIDCTLNDYCTCYTKERYAEEVEYTDYGGEEFSKTLEAVPENKAICQGNKACEACLGDGEDGYNSWTVFGCLSTSSSQSFVNQILTIALGVAGGIAFLLMIFGALQIILSAGNPDRVKAGKEIIVAALGGLFLILFSVLILRIIGVDILGIEGFK